MSIDTILASLKIGKTVFRFKSLFTNDDDTPRTMLISPEIEFAVQLPLPDNEEGRRWGELRAWLESFVELCELTVAADPFNKPPGTMLARTAPIEREVWSIRVTEPLDTPGIRAFGGFPEQDAFIALTYEFREVIDDDFSGSVEAAFNAWNDYFSERPFEGDSLNDYLTNYLAV